MNTSEATCWRSARNPVRVTRMSLAHGPGIPRLEVQVRTILLAAALLVSGAACAPRAVTVSTGDQPASEVSLRVTNDLSQAINVYIRSGASDVFVKQVAANTVEWVPVQGFRAGTSVTLVARPVSGSPTYTRSIVLSQTVEWRVP